MKKWIQVLNETQILQLIERLISDSCERGNDYSDTIDRDSLIRIIRNEIRKNEIEEEND